MPALYDLTLKNTGVHYAEHISFVLLGLLFWSQVLDSPPFHQRLEPLGRAVYVTAGLAARWLLAVVLALATSPLYPAVPYVAVHSGSSTAEQFGLIGLPETLYLDRRGRIDSVTWGQVSAPALERGLARVTRD